MEFIEFSVDSEEYKKALILRRKILREPLKLDISPEDLSTEKDQLHFGLFNDNEIKACVIAVPMNDGIAKVRQMAVRPELQNQGLGSKLLLLCMADLKQKGFRKVELNARKTAVDFYKKYGFQICSDEFIEVTIPHFKMFRDL